MLMVIGPDSARNMRAGEEGEVDALLRAAFPGPEEAELVRALRESREMAAEMVLPWESRIAAYAGISRMVAPGNWFCLAPVAVRPEWQRGALGAGQGERNAFHFGTRLVGMLGDAWRAGAGKRLIKGEGREGDEPATLVVFGKPSFYARAGFSSERAVRFRSPYSVDRMLILRPGADVPERELVYPAAFEGLD